MPGEYWNHNTAYHPMIVSAARRLGGRALDVGCGEGLLLQRLAPVMDEVVGIDPDPAAIEDARERLDGRPGVRIIEGSFLDADPADDLAGGLAPGSFDLITFVATLHHMPLRPALARARELLTPGGELIIVGLSKENLAEQLLRGAIRMPWNRLAGRIHGEGDDVQVRVADPKESTAEIREAARVELPGSTLSYGLYFRYLLRWRKR